MKKAILIYGPPGAGKGTQSELLTRKFSLINFDTGSYIESLVHDPEKQTLGIIRKERKLFDSGTLNTPSWVLSIVKRHVKEIAHAGFGLVLSGSPRTLFEAFGDSKTEGLMDVLKREYGLKNILIFQLVLKNGASIRRNSSRLVCSLCKSPILGKYYAHIKICPFCGAKLFKRTLDNKETIKKRLEQYKNRTYPIIAELKNRGYGIIQIDGSSMPKKVFESVSARVKRGR